MDVVSASIPYPATNNYSAFMLSAFAAPGARLLFTDDPLLLSPNGQLESAYQTPTCMGCLGVSCARNRGTTPAGTHPVV